MTVYALIIINKAGGLIYHHQFDDSGLNKLSTNDYLVLAGTFHGPDGPDQDKLTLKLSNTQSVHAITARLNPISQPRPSTPPGGISSRPDPPSGLEVLETENFRMQCFNTLTGTKFLLFTDINQTNVDVSIRRIYDLYTDFVMKNPFYQLEMPVRCELFERKLQLYIKEINNR